MQYRLAQTLAGLLLVLCFAQASHLLQSSVIDQRNVAQLTDMSRQLLRRTELSVDYAVSLMGEQLERGIAVCEHGVVMAAKSEVLNRGLLKDIEVIREPYRTECSASGNETFLIDAFLARFPAKNSNISLQLLNQSANGLMRVRWKQDDELTLAAILNFDSLIYDVLPEQLREKSRAQILIGNDQPMAHFGALETPEGDNALLTKSASTRYPIAVAIYASRQELALWNRSSDELAYGLGAVIGAILALVLVLHYSRPLNFIDELSLAIACGEIVPFYQPTFSLNDRSIIGCEVLVRWMKPDGGMIRPDTFIPIAESTGLIFPMTMRVIKDSCTVLSGIVRTKGAFKVAFNVTPQHFVQPGFLDQLCSVLSDCNFPQDQVVLELTERQTLDDSSIVSAVATEARKRGIRIALDDTGSGHNGLAHVQDVPLDMVKIDKRFVDLIGTNPVARSIVQMLVHLANDIGASTIAEGIETEAQLQELIKLGVNAGQGYLVAPALDLEKFQGFINKSNHAEMMIAEKTLLAA